MSDEPPLSEQEAEWRKAWPSAANQELLDRKYVQGGSPRYYASEMREAFHDGWAAAERATPPESKQRVDGFLGAGEPDARIATEPDASVLERIRSAGWMVVCHNDYRLRGEPHTFWSFARGNEYVRGEGRSDREALEACEDAIAVRNTPAPTDATREAAAEILAAMPRCGACPAPARFEDAWGIPRCGEHTLPLGMFPVEWLPALEAAERIAKGRADG